MTATPRVIRVALGLLGWLATGGVAQAQSRDGQQLGAGVRRLITPAALERHARAIVEPERPSGSNGENAAIAYIVATLRSDSVPVEVYSFDAYASDPVRASVEVVGSDFAPQAITLAFSGATDGIEAPLIDVGGLGDLPDLEVGTGERLVLPASTREKHPELGGAIALVTGQPRNGPTIALSQLGAAAIIFVNPEERLNDLIVTSTWGTPSLRNFHRLPRIPVAEITKSAGDELRRRMRAGPLRIRIRADVRTGWKAMRLAVARVPGPDPVAPYVLFGGHIDAWYHGGTDEGASNAAMVELARAFYRNRGQLRRGLVVAWWPGHSNARYGGSTWFADHFFEELRDRAVAYLNVDGIGQTGAKRFGATATASLEGLATRIIRLRAGAEGRMSRPGRNSDQSFNGIAIPLLQLNHSRLADDGGYWWWHTPDDTFDKIDFSVLKLDTDLYADALSELLAAPVLPVDLATEVRDLGQAIADRQRVAGSRFDLGEVARRQGRLLALVRDIDAAASKAGGRQVDVELIRLLRPVHRILYTPSDPYNPDPGVDLGLLPGLAPVAILAAEPPDSDRYRFAMTSLIRERNRLLDALADALGQAERLRTELGGRPTP